MKLRRRLEQCLERHSGGASSEGEPILSRYSLCGEGLCIGHDGGDTVCSEYKPRFAFTGGGA